MSPKFPRSLALLLALLSIVDTQIEASGVFELELINFQQLDLRSSQSKTQRNSTDERSKRPDEPNILTLFVCLKQQFASNLDGPCLFGNASIVLLQNKDEEAGKLRQPHEPTPSSNPNGNQNQTEQLSNIARIFFTFKWMVSSFPFSSDFSTRKQIQIEMLLREMSSHGPHDIKNLDPWKSRRR